MVMDIGMGTSICHLPSATCHLSLALAFNRIFRGWGLYAAWRWIACFRSASARQRLAEENLAARRGSGRFAANAKEL